MESVAMGDGAPRFVNRDFSQSDRAAVIKFVAKIAFFVGGAA
jgi:hypothetical protein